MVCRAVSLRWSLTGRDSESGILGFTRWKVCDEIRMEVQWIDIQPKAKESLHTRATVWGMGEQIIAAVLSGCKRETHCWKNAKQYETESRRTNKS
jgi:hypothetical protein